MRDTRTRDMLEQRYSLTAADEREVGELLLAAREADGRPEDAAVTGGGRHLLLRESGELAGYAHIDTEGDAFGRQVAELIVHPDFRRRGIGTRLARALTEQVPEKLRVWAHGDHPAAARIAEHEGFTRARELLKARTIRRSSMSTRAPSTGIPNRAASASRNCGPASPRTGSTRAAFSSPSATGT